MSEANEPSGDGSPAAFRLDLLRLGAEARAAAGTTDVAHLRRIERWGRRSEVAGWLSALWVVNPLSVLLLAIGANTRWVVQHHVSHGAYEGLPTAPRRYNRSVFAHGWRRTVDWLDWIEPAAWHTEHDLAHHYQLGEDGDPDLLERNVAWLRRFRWWPRVAWPVMAVFSLVWRLTYYAPATFRVHAEAEARRAGEPRPVGLTANPIRPYGRRFWWHCILPKAIGRFVAPTLLALLIGRRRARALLVNLVLAEMLENLHSFSVIAPGHTGPDLFRFTTAATRQGEHLLRQIVGSTNFSHGNDLHDHLHLWLNYQIEHHVWPDLTLLQYRRLAPRLAELCEHYGVPYCREPLSLRLLKMMRVVDGSASMRSGPPYTVNSPDPYTRLQ